MMLLKRQYAPEIMDDFSITDERIDKALKELIVINRFLGGNSTTIKGLTDIMEKTPAKQSYRILDVGAGGNNLFNTINNNINVTVKNVNVDLNIRACRFGKRLFPESDTVCADALALPFKKESFDIVHTSLFLHHFTEDEIKRLLNSFLDVACYGIVINDLQRSIFALAGIKLLTVLFSRSEFVKNDAPLSVKKAFKRSELLSILKKIKAAGFNIKWRWAFRWLLIIYK